MKIVLMKVCIFILMVTMLLTSCRTDEKENSTAEDNTTTVEEEEEEEEEEGDIDVSLLDRALLEMFKVKWPDSYKMISIEDNNEVITNITLYRKGYSEREESESEGITTVEIYNADKGITYEYTIGDTTGTMEKDDEKDIELIDREKAMEGRSLMSIYEEAYGEDLIIKAKNIRMLGRKAIEIELSSGSPKEGEEDVVPWLFIFDSKYTVALKSELVLSEEYYIFTEATEVEFNKKIDDSLFEPPNGIDFVEE